MHAQSMSLFLRPAQALIMTCSVCTIMSLALRCYLRVACNVPLGRLQRARYQPKQRGLADTCSDSNNSNSQGSPESVGPVNAWSATHTYSGPPQEEPRLLLGTCRLKQLHCWHLKASTLAQHMLMVCLLDCTALLRTVGSYNRSSALQVLHPRKRHKPTQSEPFSIQSLIFMGCATASTVQPTVGVC